MDETFFPSCSACMREGEKNNELFILYRTTFPPDIINPLENSPIST